jgi:hypothetical protein
MNPTNNENDRDVGKQRAVIKQSIQVKIPTTRSSVKKEKRMSSEMMTSEIVVETPSPHAAAGTRSLNRSHSDSSIVCSPKGLKFPFFDEQNNTSASQNYDMFLSPPGAKHQKSPFQQISSEWESELSPIVRNRGSDASQEVLDVPIMDDCSSPPPSNSSASPRDVDTNGDEQTLEVSELAPTNPREEEDGDDEDIRDLSSARKQVGQSSHEFIERIRNAAHKRKVAMTRSRDSLAAKEEEQLRSIAERSNQQAAASNNRSSSTPEGEDATVEHHSTKNRDNVDASAANKMIFKARPLPPTTGVLGSGGLDGIPKVDKRPTTTPFSPLLGSRRPQKTRIKALEAPKEQPAKSGKPKMIPPVVVQPTSPVAKKENDLVRPFKARAVPAAVRSAGSSGQYGIPKVEKRPLTVAMSPQLGPRRRAGSADARLVSDVQPKVNDVTHQSRKSDAPRIPVSSRVTRSRTRSTDTSSSVTSRKASLSVTSESPVLLGLNLLHTPKTIDQILENDENRTPKHPQTTIPFEPHSTRRAKKRAEFDTRRKTMFDIRSAKEMKERETNIRKIQRELHVLRQEL